MNIEIPESVKRQLAEEPPLELDPARMLAVIDLIFGFEPDRFPPS